MLYLNAGYHTLSTNSIDVDLSGWLGQSYYAGQFSAKFGLSTPIPSFIEFEGVAFRQKYYNSEILFYESKSPSFITDVQEFLRLNYCWAMGTRGKGYVNISYGREANIFYPEKNSEYYTAEKDKSIYHIAALKTGIEYNTLNDLMYPSSGRNFYANIIIDHETNKFKPGDGGMEVKNKGHFTGSAEILWKNYFSVHKNFRIGGLAHGVATIAKLYENYTCTMIHAPAFAPTPSTRNYFNPAFRSTNWIAAGFMPVWVPMNRAQLRGDFYIYCPVRNISPDKGGFARYDGWFRNPQFIGEIAAVYNLPFASLSVYANYLTSPHGSWNFGVNFGLFFQAPKILR